MFEHMMQIDIIYIQMYVCFIFTIVILKAVEYGNFKETSHFTGNILENFHIFILFQDA